MIFLMASGQSTTALSAYRVADGAIAWTKKVGDTQGRYHFDLYEDSVVHFLAGTQTLAARK
jgi:hypothetical protein